MKSSFLLILVSSFLLAKPFFPSTNSSYHNDNSYKLILTSFNVLDFPDSCGIDPYEPNDNPESAYPLEFGDIVSGAFICPLEDYDYFTFEAEQGDYVRIYEITPVTLRPVIYILNQNLTPVFNNLYTTDMQFFISNPGKYYIVVTKRYYHTEPFEYSFGLEKIEITPDIISVTDVPNDQGLQVKVVWKPSYFDPQQGINQTDYYALWREETDSVTMQSNVSGNFESFDKINYSLVKQGNSIYNVGGNLFNFIAQIPAVSNRPFINYSYIAPTLYDNVPTTFIVSAIPKSGFYLPDLWGAPGTGVSIDNLTPQFVNYNIQAHSEGTAIEWNVDRIIHYDIEGFNIYRQLTPGVSLIPENLIAALNAEYDEYLDLNVISGQDYYYILEVFDNSGNSSFSSELSLTISNIAENQFTIPKEFRLMQNFPNPFNPSTEISWQSPVGSHQTLKIYDILGREVATLVDEFREAGRYEVNFDASRLASGVYIYRLSAGSFVESNKMLLIK
jgi:hypothetical protein